MQGLRINISSLLLIYFALASMSLSLNIILGLPGSISITHPVVVLLISLAIFYFSRDKINKSNLLYTTFCFVVLVIILFYQLLEYNSKANIKNALYIVFAIAIAKLCSRDEIDLSKTIKYTTLIFSVTAILGTAIFIASGQARIGLSSNLPFIKQEYTIIFTIYIGLYFYRLKMKLLNNSDHWILLSILVSSALIPIKTIYLIFAIFSIYTFRKKIKDIKLLITLIAAAIVILYFFPPETFKIYYAFYISNEYLDPEVFRQLDTILVRQTIIEENLKGLTSNLLTFIFGSGINFTQNMIYISENSWYQQELGLAFESGILFFLLNFGVLGTTLLLFVFYKIITGKGNLQYKYVFLALLISNIPQDNVGSMFWFCFGLALSNLSVRNMETKCYGKSEPVLCRDG